MQKEKKLIYLICPIRNITLTEKEHLEGYVAFLEKCARKVHYPPRDVNQVDSVGLRILSEHRQAMKKADYIDCYFNPQSSGSSFDFGMAYQLGKLPWHIINNADIKEENLQDFDRFIFANSLVT
jgi:hypothetical protein